MVSQRHHEAPLTKACDRLGNASNFMGCKVLTLGDNLTAPLAYTRRRAKDFHVLTQIRRMSVIGLVKGIRFTCRCFPSQLNVADFDSGNLGTVRSSSHQVRQRESPVGLPTSAHSQVGDLSSEYDRVPVTSSCSSAYANDISQCLGKNQDGGASDSAVKEFSGIDERTPRQEKVETGRLDDDNRG